MTGEQKKAWRVGAKACKDRTWRGKGRPLCQFNGTWVYPCAVARCPKRAAVIEAGQKLLDAPPAPPVEDRLGEVHG